MRSSDVVLGKANFKSTALGGIASLPGMMCTCCAAPIAVGLRKKNVSIGASLAFWLGNPVLNPATLIFMTFVLSWKFTLMRVVFGLILTFAVSHFANKFAGNSKIPQTVDETVKKIVEPEGPLIIRWLRSAGSMLLTVVPAYFITVLLLGAARAYMFPVLGDGVTNGILAILIFAIAGTLFVIPTAAEIPIIGTFLSFGLGTGAAGALLVTLPSISLPSLLMVLAYNEIRRSLLEKRPQELYRQRLAARRIDYTRFLRSFNRPALCIVGDFNEFGVNCMKEMVSQLPHAQLAIIPDALDPSNLCQPEKFNAILQRFLEKQQGNLQIS